MRILYLYRWATMGGVERVLLNRARVFRDRRLPIYQGVHFLEDLGGSEAFSRAIQADDLQEYLGIEKVFAPQNEDLLISIDTPEALELGTGAEPIWFECHTAYRENRLYLRDLPDRVPGILAPSHHFARQLLRELPAWEGRIHALRNPVPPYRPPDLRAWRMPRWNKHLIAYIGRIDGLKNTDALIQLLGDLRQKRGDEFLLLFVGATSDPGALWKTVEQHGILDRFIYLPPVSFERVPYLLAMLRENRGIFMSASKGESFGLSAAEAIMAELPVVLSEAHRDLVGGREAVLYPLEDREAAEERILSAFAHYEEMSQISRELQSLFSEEVFLEDWQRIFPI